MPTAIPTIVLASPKGRTGKSTSAVVLAAELACKSAAVTIIDVDPNRSISHWAHRPGCPNNIVVVANTSEATVIDEIEDAATRTPFVIVDLEGTASMTVAYAISRADLVIVPTQGSQLDTAKATKASRLIGQPARTRLRSPYPLCSAVHTHKFGHPRAHAAAPPGCVRPVRCHRLRHANA